MKKLLLFFAALLSTASQLQSKTFVLVHGAFVDATAWDQVKKGLEARGHQVFAVNLPGHLIDRSPFDQISLQSDVDSVVRVIRSIQGPVILVGHSLGGMIIAQVEEIVPENYGHATKFVIETNDDQAITDGLQKQMIESNKATVRKVYPVKAGHLPFLSQPKKVMAILNSL